MTATSRPLKARCLLVILLIAASLSLTAGIRDSLGKGTRFSRGIRCEIENVVAPSEFNRLDAAVLRSQADIIAIVLAVLVTAAVGALISNYRQRKLYQGLFRAERDRLAALQESEVRYRSVAQYTYDWEYWRAPDGSLLYTSPSCERITGYSAEEFIQNPNLLETLVHPDDRHVLAQHRNEASHEDAVHGVHEADFRIVRRDGEVRWIGHVCQSIRREDGTSLGRRGSNRDITERKRAEAALRESMDRFHRTLDNMLEGCQIIGFDWRYRYVNDAAARHGRLTREELLGRSMTEAYPGIENTEMFTVLKRCMEERTPGQMENEFEYPDGTTKWFELSIQPVSEGIFILSIDMSERKQAEKESLKRLTELEALHRISSALRTAGTADDALPILLDRTLAVLGTKAGIIWLYHPASGFLRTAVARGWFSTLDEAPMVPGEGIAGWVFETGKMHVSHEFIHDPRVRSSAREQIPAGWGGACVPIRTGETAVGVLFVSVPLPRELTADETKMLQSLAEMAGAALHRMRLHEETLRRLSHLQALQTVDQAITASLDLRLTLDVLLEQTIDQLSIDAAGVLLLDPRSNALAHAAGRGFRTAAYERSIVRLGEGTVGRAALDRGTSFIADLANESGEFTRSELLADEGFVSYLGAPLVTKGQVKGVLEVFHRARLSPDPEWLDFFEALARQAAIAIDSAQLFESLQRSSLQLTVAYDATIEGWSRALDMRDKETEGHTRRVTDLTMRLSRAMGIDEEEIVHIGRGALLHDIGKMGVPDGILFKPGPLSEEEWEVIRRHPRFAYELLTPIAFLRPALHIPYCHHERWDGSGYPRGLKGEAIPLSARIFAVVDVWDAITSNRPYRSAMPAEKALKYLGDHAGKLFDPQVVKVFLEEMGKQRVAEEQVSTREAGDDVS